MWKKASGLILALLIIFLLPSMVLADNAGVDQVNVSVEVEYMSELARAVFPLVNAFRAETDVWYWNSDNSTKTVLNNLEMLSYDYELEKVAMRRAAETAIYWSHTRPDDTKCYTIYPSGLTVAAENIACGQESAAEVMTAWREENEDYDGQGHRRNMLDADITHIGVGCVKVEGRLFWVQVFFAGNEPSTTIKETNPFSMDASLSLLKSKIRNVSSPVERLQVNEGKTVDAPMIIARTAQYAAFTITNPQWETEENLVTVNGSTIQGNAGGFTTVFWKLSDKKAVELPVRVVCANHTWGDDEILSEPTCVATGLKKNTCTVCQEEKTEVIPIDPDAHDWAEPTYKWDEKHESVTATRLCNHDTSHEQTETVQATSKVALEPTCLEKGKTTYTGKPFKNEAFKAQEVTETDIKALGHDYVKHQAKAPTCTAIGWDAYDTCSRCDYTTYVEKAVLGHDTINHQAKAPTCTAIGWDAYDTCSRCDYTTYVEKAALGHDYINHKAKAPTCTGIGWDAYDTCSRCDYTTYVEKAALGHDTINHQAKEPTCTAIGWDAYDTCSRCDYTTYVEEAALGHDTVNHKAKAPTCTEIGWDAYDTCSRCDYTTYAEKAALGHDIVHHEAKEPTCTEVGWDAYDTCSRCEYTTYAEKKALGHDPIPHEAKEPTCTEIGWNAYDTCKREGCEYTTYVEKPALEHAWGKAVYVWADDYSSVTATRICANDASHSETETVTATYQVITEATTKKTGTGRYTSASFTNPAFTVQTKDVKIAKYPKTFSDNSCKYTIKDNLTATVTGPKKKSLKTITIPDTITVNGKEMKVVGIDASAFSGNTKIAKVTIGENVTSIGAKAFYKCTKLATCTIPDSSALKTIGNSAFEGAKVLKKINIPEKVTKIGKKAFYNCAKLANVTIRTTKLKESSIGANAFGKNPKKATYNLPKSKFKNYTKWLKKKGANVKATYKKLK